MSMRIIILFLFIAGLAWADDGTVTVVFDQGAEHGSEQVRLSNVDGIPCCTAQELNRALNASFSEDVIERRLRLTLYDEQFVFLVGSPFVNCGSERYNCSWPVVNRNGAYYIPLSFLTDVLPLAMPERIHYDAARQPLHAGTPVDNSIHTIIIDAGHGGKDPGALGATRGVQEKDVTLSMALKLKAALQRELPDVKIVLTRDDDTFIPLYDRSRQANENGGDLFISLHCNAHKNRSAHGIEVFFLSTAKTTDERAVEALENSVVLNYEGGQEALQRYDDLSFILMDMAQTEQLRESSELAYKLLANMVGTTGGESRGVRQANLYVLRVSYMPAVLIELGFISNKEEEKKLLNDDYQNKLIAAITEGVKSFKFKFDQVR